MILNCLKMKKSNIERIGIEKFKDSMLDIELVGGVGGPAENYDEFVQKFKRTGTNIGGGNGEPFTYDEHQDYNEDGQINGNDSYYEETHPGTGN